MYLFLLIKSKERQNINFLLFSFFCFQQKKQRTLPTAGNPQRLMKEYFLSFASNKRNKELCLR
jgi:hypothetical protein